jgi:hypothetical protein
LKPEQKKKKKKKKKNTSGFRRRGHLTDAKKEANNQLKKEAK